MKTKDMREVGIWNHPEHRTNGAIFTLLPLPLRWAEGATESHRHRQMQIKLKAWMR